MDPFKLSEESKLPLHKLVYNKLKESILTGKLKPGEKLVENTISKEMSISKTPIREALRELAKEGLIIHHTRRGISVIDFTEKDIDEIISLRAEIEAFGIRLALPRITQKEHDRIDKLISNIQQYEQEKKMHKLVESDLLLHAYFMELSGHSRLLKTWQMLSSQISVLLHMIDYYKIAPVYSSKSHRKLIDSIFSGDISFAESAVRNHILESGKNIMDHFKKLKR